VEGYRHRNRSRYVLAALVVGQFFLLGYQVRSPQAGGVRLIRLWTLKAVLPAERLSSGVFGGVRAWFGDYVTLRHTRGENDALRAEVGRLELQNQQLREAAREVPELTALLGFQRGFELRTVAAQVIGSSSSTDAQLLYLNRGTENGLRLNMAVLTPEGVVGKLTQVLSNASQVLLISDPESGAGVLIGNQGVHGILHGLGAGRAEIERVLKDEPVQVGDAVVTSGEDQVYPKGLKVGTVTGVGASHDGVFKTVSLRLAANLGRLEQVLVVTAQLPVAAETQDSGLTAADVRQARLPSLPESQGTGNREQGTAKAAAAPKPAAPHPGPGGPGGKN
jgi:rod shape-determining protein MreC